MEISLNDGEDSVLRRNEGNFGLTDVVLASGAAAQLSFTVCFLSGYGFPWFILH